MLPKSSKQTGGPRVVVQAILPTLLSVALFAMAVFGYILPTTEKAVMAKKREMIRELIDTTWSVLQSNHTRHRNGTISLEEAQLRAREMIRDIRYGPDGDDYFWINDMSAKMVMHPFLPDLEGIEITDENPHRAKQIMVECVRVVKKEGSGFIEYQWQAKDDPRKVVPKISYVRGFEPWGWIIGTGIYVEDVRAEMAALTRWMTYVSLAILALTSVLFGYLTTRSIRATRERQEARQALVRKSEEYRAVLEASPNPTIVYDNEGRAGFVNPAFTRVFGWRAEEVVGARIDFVPEENQAETMAGIKRLIEDEEAYVPLESRRRTRDGRILEVSINAAVIRGLENEPQGIVVNLVDITDRKRAERALWDSEQRYRDLINNVTDIIFTHDLEGRLLNINRTATLTLGYEISEMVGRPVSDFMKPEHRGAFKTEYLTAIRAHGRAEGVTVYLGKDGREHYVEYRNVLVNKDGQPSHIHGSGREITDRIMAQKQLKLLENRLRHAQKMEAVGTLAGGIAHDFNNILQVIGGHAQLLQGADPKSDRERGYLNQIRGAVDRASELVTRLLTFSRKVEPELRPVDLNNRVRQAIKIMDRTMPKMITLESTLDDDLVPILGDSNQIDQILLNLGKNAEDAMPGGGRLSIATRMTELEAEFCRRNPGSRPGRYAELIIADTGQGIEPEEIEHIFDPFYTTKEVGRGTGLGLSMVYGIIKSHHGYIRCQSRTGRGTSFSLFWPLAGRPDIPGEALRPVSETIAPGREKILIVDDEEAILNVSREMLTQAGYTVSSATSGEEALEVLGSEGGSADLVIMDLGMPGMGGQKALEEMVRRYPGIRVLISSGYTADEQVQACLEAGAGGFVAKPFRLDKMLAEIRNALDRE